MDKTQQRLLGKWLKTQSQFGKKWLYLTIGISFLSGLFLVLQAASLAHILHALIIEKIDKYQLIIPFILLTMSFLGRALCSYAKEQTAFNLGKAVRLEIRKLILDKLEQLGPVAISEKPVGTWANLLLEQVEDMQDFFSRYLPQLAIAVLIPIIILVAVFPLNWAAGLIFLLTAPLVPFFMALVGMSAADANRRNVKALQRLSGHFFDRLKSLNTIKLFDQVEKESQYLHSASENFRQRTMEVLRLAFLSSAVLEFFTAISIALTAVYFGFSFIGELNFGHYGAQITLFTGFFILLLAPEFYQPLRDLGSYYHAKAQAIGAAESIVEFLNQEPENPLLSQSTSEKNNSPKIEEISIQAKDLEIYSANGVKLLGPISFNINAQQKVAIIGKSGSGKTSLLNALLGFLPYQGSLTIAGIELNQIQPEVWRDKITWVGQNPQLFHGNIRENIVMAKPQANEDEILGVIQQSHADEFIAKFPNQLDYQIGDRASGLSVGQAQRIALARALLKNADCWLLDEPTASLDQQSEGLILDALNKATENKTTIWVTHNLHQLEDFSHIFILEQGKLIEQGSFQDLKQKNAFNNQLSADRDLSHA